MLEITTDKQVKKILLDNHTFNVREPGAGESLTMQKAGREIKSLEQKQKASKLTKAEQERMEELSIDSLQICLDVFEAENEEGEKYLNRIQTKTLLDVIAQVFGEPEDSDLEEKSSGAKGA